MQLYSLVVVMYQRKEEEGALSTRLLGMQPERN